MMEYIDRVEQIMNTLESELDTYGELQEIKAKAETIYKSTRAKLLFSSKQNPSLKTVADREAWVDAQLEDELLNYRIAEGKADAEKERVRTLRALLSGAQTLNSAGRV